jgi:hypothetical protein
MMHKTNWNKKLLPSQDFKSSWDWTVAHSEYHFDDSIKDKEGDWFKVLGRFDNPSLWKAEADRLVRESSKAINWQTRKFFGASPKESPMLEQEEYDIAQGGGDPKKLMLTNMKDELDDYPMLNKMKEHFGVIGDEKEFKVRCHSQLTGQMFNLHIDKLWDRCPEDPEKICRITFFLEDWRPGQFYLYGNFVYERWKAGEAHIFDWSNVPHATANASNHPRPCIQITGLKSERTRELIANGSRDTVWTLD